MSLRVIQVGTDTAWCEAPLRGWRKFGVPEGGAFDRESWAWCCALAESDRALEVGPFGALIRAESPVSVVVTGAIRSILVDDKPHGLGRFGMAPGQVLQIGAPIRGSRSYLSPCQGTRHSMPRRALAPTFAAAGDVISGVIRPDAALGGLPESLSQGPIRVVPGPQAHAFDLQPLLSQLWEVSLAADRTGIRLAGPRLDPNEPWGERASEPQTTGTIQVTSGGTPIVIGPDGPTLGGYPKIAVVIDADRDRLGQVKPGDRIRFQRVEFDEARTWRRQYHARLRLALASRL